MSAKGDQIVNIGRRFEAIVFADKIDEYLENNSIERILLNNEKLGSADDIGFLLKGNLLVCIQAKGSETDFICVLSDLFSVDGRTSESVIQKLFNSFKKIKEGFPNYNFKIIYATSKSPSQSKRNTPKFEGGTPEKISLQEFIRNYWTSFKNGSLDRGEFLRPGILNEWFKKFKDHLDCGEGTLFEFFDKLEFNFDIVFFEKRRQYIKNQLEKHYSWFLTRKFSIIESISIEEYLQEIDSEFVALLHDFPYDESLYVKKGNLSNIIEQTVRELEKGYIFLQGGPGTGKSTFLQTELKNLSNIVIFKYLCFRDDRLFSLKARGEAGIFFKDINNQFSRYLDKYISKGNEEDKFIRYLIDLSKKANEINRKILIIIDGVDHISRRQKVSRSFLEKLPKPNQLPDKIIFLVSGQHFKDIAWYNDFNLPESLIKDFIIEPFSFEEISDFLKKRYSQNFEIEKINKLLEKTGGNPQYINMICNKYDDFSDFNENFEQLLNDNPDFKNDMYQIYEEYWKTFNFESDSDFIRIIGLLSRIIGPMDINWIKNWSEIAKIGAFFEKFDFMFLRIDNLLFFEYNTFKDYLYEKSALILNRFDDERSKSYYSILSDYSDKFNSTGIHNWYKIYYLIESGKKEEILKLNRKFFINQFINLRPVQDIIEDITILLNYAYNIPNYELTFKLFFLKGEFEARNNQYEDLIPNLNKLLNFFFEKSEYILYIVAIMLQSENIHFRLKLKLINNFLGLENIDEDLERLFFEFYFKNKAAIPLDIYRQDLIDYVDEWIYFNCYFYSDLTDLFIFFKSIFKELFETKFQKQFFLIPDFIYTIFKFGEFLIENERFDELNLIYKCLEEIIIKGEWKIYPFNWGKYKNLETKDFYSHGMEFGRSNPFSAIFLLKLIETYKKGEKIIEKFIKDYPIYRILWIENTDNSALYYKLHFYPREISINQIKFFIQPGPLMRFGLAGNANYRIKERFYLYRQIESIFPIKDNDKLLNLFNEYYEESNLTHLLLNNEHYYFRWEKLIRDFALLTMDDNEEELKKNITGIFDLMNSNPDFRLHWYFYFEDFLFALIDQLRKSSNSVKNHFIQELKQKFENGTGKFQNYLVQLTIYNKILIEFENETVIDTIKKIIESNISKILATNEPWEDINIFNKSISSLNLIKEKYKEFFKTLLPKLQSLFEKITFRIGPRKDYQLFILIPLLENIINFFNLNDSEFKDDLKWLVKVLNFVSNPTKTEHNAINIIKKYFLEIIENWNPEVYSEFSFQLTYHERYYNNPPDEIKIDDEILNSLDDMARDLNIPEKFFLKIKEFKDWNSRNVKRLFQKIYSKNDNSEEWYNFLSFLIQKNPYFYSIFEYSSFADGLIDFFKELIENEESISQWDEDIESKLVRARLYAPGDKWAFNSNLEDLYQLNQDWVFKWGWENLKHFMNKRKYIWYILVAGEGWVIYTFLTKINSQNYKTYWNIYMNYLRELFDFIL